MAQDSTVPPRLKMRPLDLFIPTGVSMDFSHDQWWVDYNQMLAKPVEWINNMIRRFGASPR